MTTVTLAGLVKRFGADAPVIDQLDITIESGSLTALLGPSGCGKTTTLKLIAGLLTPTAGEIRFDNQSVIALAPEDREAVMVFQNHLLFPYLSVADNVGFGLKMRRVPKTELRSRVADMLELVQLPDIGRRTPASLSGGQQQRVALARALVIEPRVLLLDEPLSNLDAHLRDEMRELIHSIHSALGITTVVVTHDQEEAVILADRVGLLLDGSIRQVDSPKAFFERPASAAVARFFGGSNFLPGTWTDGLFHTDIGSFTVPSKTATSGPAVLTIRPEDVGIEIPTAGGDVDTPLVNTVAGVVRSSLYGGRYARFEVAVGSRSFDAITEPRRFDALASGRPVTVRFPPEKVWLLPE